MKNGKALGKGLEGILSVSKEEVKALEEEREESKGEERVVTLKVKTSSLGEKTIVVIRDVVDEIEFKTVGTTDPFTVVYLEILRSSIPMFKVAKELGSIVREYVERENPELAKLIKEILARKGVKI